jgi:hypothetical protein
MPANYPASVKTFTSKVDNIDAVVAADVNSSYEEITAIETTLGINPAVSSTWSGSFSTTSTQDFLTVNARLDNIEFGVNTAFNNRVRTNGGSTIASTSTTVGLTLSTTGTGNLFSAGNTVINSSGNIVNIDGGTA